MKNSLIITIFLYSTFIFAQKTIENKTKMCEILTEMRNEDQHYRKGKILGSLFVNEKKYSKKEIDSVWALQIEIDNRNTEKLIEITKKYGWISDERIDCPKLNIWLIFRHSQNVYFDDISKLIEKEHNERRLKNSHYKFIKNHLQGRPRM